MSTALHQSAVHILSGRTHSDKAMAVRVSALIASHRAACRREAQPGEGCTDIDCPFWAACPGTSARPKQ